jgi:HAD superfamily hydrolase (TIGR01484 family)
MSSSGRPRPLTFRENLERLPGAFNRGASARVEHTRAAFVSNKGNSFVVVGSGASFSAAAFISKFVGEFFEIPARCKNPYDYYTSETLSEGTILVSASGNNKDILAALDKALASRAKPLIVITSNPKSDLLRNVEGYSDLVSVTIEPSKHDEREGFFGVQSLLEVLGAFVAMVPHLERRIRPAEQWCKGVCESVVSTLDNQSDLISALSKTIHVVGLASDWALPCLNDLESKFVEGGLGWLEMSEAKNFTHGRFVNSLRRKEETAVLFLATRDSTDLLETFQDSYGSMLLIVPIISQSRGVLGGIELFIYMFHLFVKLAEYRRVDISRPKVPPEAKQMFRARSLYPNLEIRPLLEQEIDGVVKAKRALLSAQSPSPSDLERLVPKPVVAASLSFLFSRQFVGLVCDYDGTLISLPDHQSTVSEAIIFNLERLLQAGIPIAIVSGRGRSVVSDLQEQVPSFLHKLIYCYLYNGGALWKLDECEARWVQKLKKIEILLKDLKASAELSRLVDKIEPASLSSQITLHLRNYDNAALVMDIATKLISNVSATDYCVRTSGRSVDIFPSSVSKVSACLDFKQEAFPDLDEPLILVLGDRGESGGNDYELLKEPYSISVNQMNWEPHTCFPVIDEQGSIMSGPTATANVLQRIRVNGSGFFLSPSSIRQRDI